MTATVMETGSVALTTAAIFVPHQKAAVVRNILLKCILNQEITEQGMKETGKNDTLFVVFFLEETRPF